MEVREIKHGNSVLYQLKGNMNGIDAVRFSKTVEIFRGSGCSKIFVDLRNVAAMDSSAIGGLIYLNTVMKNSGVELLLVSTRDQLCELFREFSFEKVFTLLDTSKFHEQSETQSSNRGKIKSTHNQIRERL